ncbi:hypothetical protein HQ865_07395 [Mucilaginibacter mali]|uniref:Transporter n=1 Tax=Mucilaginibacter mali TaxID=2740462 RepID=A0A7D4UPG0_9SPHI|nr:hypothetical protein HQ865_07395 [Mucilaginibacter mali]
MKPLLTAIIFILFFISTSQAQDNYEIQVYGSSTVEKGQTMVELHSNFTFDGSKTTVNGVLPTNHVFHETIEITHGWTSCFETGFYIFNSVGNDGRTAYVGSHLRPRVAAPESWHWPVGVSLSTEFGFQKAAFAGSTFDLEIRPIVDKKWNKLYVSFNPTLGKSFAGEDSDIGFVFEPNLKASYDVSNVVALGFEYYGATGRFFHYSPIQQQEHAVYLATDLNFGENWEFNAGYGVGLTQSGDSGIIKIILGRRFK